MMQEFKQELEHNILPFWSTKMLDEKHGGFHGRIDGENILHKKANKGVILNARILWTFSAAYRILGNIEYKMMADRAFKYLIQFFIDPQYGGVYWELDYLGNPVNTKKQTYAQGFALYGFSEYYRATSSIEALNLSKEFFHLIEEKCKDKKYGGYFEAFTREWNEIDDMRLSDKDANEKKSMNTHLHVLEPYTNLLRTWDNPLLRKSQKELLTIFTDKILNHENMHLNLFFNEEWIVKSSVISYGHDIEAAWLMYEAASVLNERKLLDKVKTLSVAVAQASILGIDEDGGMNYEKDESHIDREKHWWVQSEAIVGYMYAYKISGETKYKELANKVWNYTKQYIVDAENGEWVWSRLADKSINRKDDKAGFWKCPYHNSRCCLEMIENFNTDNT